MSRVTAILPLSKGYTLMRKAAVVVDTGCAKTWSNSAYLNLHKLPSALVADLEKGLTSHVLHARMGLMHELKQLVHHCLQELPVVAQESGILAHNIPATTCAQCRTLQLYELGLCDNVVASSRRTAK